MMMQSHKVIRTRSRFDARPGQAPAARIVLAAANDAVPGRGIAEILGPDPAMTIAAASTPGAKPIRLAR